MIKALLLSVLALPLLASAQTGQPDERESNWYAIEVLVFEQADNASPPPPAPVIPDLSRAIDLEERLAESGLSGGGEALFPLPGERRLLPLAADDQTLVGVEERLAGSRRYRPLVRMAWRQRTPANASPMEMRVTGGEVLARRGSDTLVDSRTLAAGGDRPATALPRGAAESDGDLIIRELDGTVTLDRGRYLHLDVDLVFRERGHRLITRGTSPAAGDAGPFGNFPTWHIGERRRIEPGTLQYFDHRRFGIIVSVTRWQPPATDDRSPDSIPAGDS